MKNQLESNNIDKFIIIIYIFINILYRDYTIIFIFLISLFLLVFLIGNYKENNIKIIAYAILICFLFTLILGRRYEGFREDFSQKKKKEKKEIIK